MGELGSDVWRAIGAPFFLPSLGANRRTVARLQARLRVLDQPVRSQSRSAEGRALRFRERLSGICQRDEAAQGDDRTLLSEARAISTEKR